MSTYSDGAEVAVWLLVFFCPLALGSAPPWTIWPIALLTSAALGLAIVGAHRQKQDLALPVVALVPGLGALMCLVQLIPLPPALLQVVSAPAAELREFILLPLGLTGNRPISMDPPSTWRELAKHLCYLAAMVTAVQLARSRLTRRRLLAAVALSGAAVALIGFAHQLLGLRKLFAMYAYAGGPPLVTTFGNPNHLAGYLALCSLVALGLALSRDDTRRTLFWLAVAVCTGTGVVLTLSRGGLVCFAFGLSTFCALSFRRKALARSKAAHGALAFVAISAIALSGGYLAYERLTAKVAAVDSVEKLQRSKLEFWPMLAQGAAHYSVAGMGRGAFELAFPKYQSRWLGATFTHPENVLLQLWSEMGAVPALVMVGFGLWAFYRLLRRPENGPAEIAVLSGVAGITLHNLIDFSLEYAAAGMACCVLLGAIAGGDDGAERRVRPRTASLAAAAAFLVLAIALVAARHTARAADLELSAESAKSTSTAQLRTLALKLIDRHPSDYLLFDIVGGAYGARRPGDPLEALAFANRALFLRPLDIDAHLIAARSLLRLNKRNQAFGEYRLAIEGAGPDDVLGEALSHARGLDELRRLSSLNAARLGGLVIRLGQLGRTDEARAVLAWSLDACRDCEGVEVLWLHEAATRLMTNEFDAALAAVDEGERHKPGGVDAPLLRAAILERRGRRDDAIALVSSLIALHPAELEVASRLSRLLAQAGRRREAREALLRIEPFVTNASQRARLLRELAAIFELEANFGKALEAYQQEVQLFPEAPNAYFDVARMFEALRRLPEAIRALNEGIARAGGAATPAQRESLVRLEEKERKRQAAGDRSLLHDEMLRGLERGDSDDSTGEPE